MVNLDRRTALKIAPAALLPTLSGRSVEADNSGAQNVEDIIIQDEVRYFSSPDQGSIVHTPQEKFVYVSLEEGFNPNPENTWIESNQSKYRPITYPRELWVNGEIKRTMWRDLDTEDNQWIVSDGLLFQVRENEGGYDLYVDGVKQELDGNINQEIHREGPSFEINRLDVKHGRSGKTEVEMDVVNNNKIVEEFNFCLNITSPSHYTRFFSETISESKTITASIHDFSSERGIKQNNQSEVPGQSPKLEVISSHESPSRE